MLTKMAQKRAQTLQWNWNNTGSLQPAPRDSLPIPDRMTIIMGRRTWLCIHSATTSTILMTLKQKLVGYINLGSRNTTWNTCIKFTQLMGERLWIVFITFGPLRCRQRCCNIAGRLMSLLVLSLEVLTEIAQPKNCLTSFRRPALASSLKRTTNYI